MSKNLIYIGNELEIFQHAVNWKTYFSSYFKQYILGSVAEIGAGIGANIPFLINNNVDEYICIEPDYKLVCAIQNKIDTFILPSKVQVYHGFLKKEEVKKFNSILYIDVLEHIQNDREEILKAYNNLNPNGYLCILVPANPGDFSAFDKSVGHFRRYNQKMIKALIPKGMNIVECKYIDSFGSFASKANKMFLKQSYPTLRQILFWDKFIVPFSSFTDKLINYTAGKSLIMVLQKTN